MNPGISTEIDYSEISKPVQELVAQEEWEAPTHKYFGKKLANGKTEKEPVYHHIEYPRIMYGLRNGRVMARMVNSQEERDALGENFATNPSAFGLITAPSTEQRLAMLRAAETVKEVTEVPEVVEAPRRGRPPAEK